MTGRDLSPFAGGGTDQPDEAAMVNSAPISLSFLKASLRRRRWIWISTAVVGLVLGASLRVAEPPKYQAAADVYLTEPPNVDAAVQIADEANLAQTEKVAQQAVTDQKWAIPPYALLSTYKATSVGDQIVRITAKAKYPAVATAVAAAVANAFLEYRGNNIKAQNQVVVDAIEKQIQALQGQVGPTNGTGTPNTQQAAADVQLSNLETTISTDNEQVASQIQNSRVIDPAALLKSTRKKIVIRDGISGLIGGLALGMALVIGQAILSDRLRRRDEIADALGAEVELSIGRYKRPRLFRNRRLARRVISPSPEMRMVARRLAARLEQSPGAALAVVSVECNEPAAVAVASVALSLAEEGGRVTVVDLAEGRPLQSLFKLPELDPSGPGDINFHSAPEPRNSLLLRVEGWRASHRRPKRPKEPPTTPRPGPMPTTTRPVVTPTTIRDPLGSWAAWDMRHESVEKWSSRDGSGQYRAWGSLRPAEPAPVEEEQEDTEIHDLTEHTPPPPDESAAPDEAPEPEPAAEYLTAGPYDQEDQEDEEEAAPERPESAGALSRIHPSPVPLVARRGSVTVVTGPDDPTQIGVHRSGSGVDAVLVLANVNPAFGAGHIASWATESVVMITAGEASSARISSTSQMLENGGIKVDSAILVGADRNDETVGTGPQEPAGTDQDRGWVQKRTWGNPG